MVAIISVLRMWAIYCDSYHLILLPPPNKQICKQNVAQNKDYVGVLSFFLF